MAKKQKLNSMRRLEASGIAYRVLTYDRRIRDAQQVAESIGLPPGAVFKTLVVELPPAKKPLLVMLPSNTTLNLKRLAKALGAKKAALASQADAEKWTGLQVGGISALALLHKSWRVCLDQRAREFTQIVISGGQRGTQLQLETAALIALLGCKIVDAADETGPSAR